MTTISPTPTPESVFITGASSGIGEETAKLLAQKGYFVFAGVRQKADQQKLESYSDHIRGVLMDVTDHDQVVSAYHMIQSEKPTRLHVINNAGVVIPGPLESLALEEFRRQFEINVFGLLDVSQVFLPLLRQTRGRLIQIGSISGLASSPYVGAYAASKFAVEAMADSMRWELSASGVQVILIEPGPIATPIWSKGLAQKDKFFASLQGETRSYYERSLKKFAILVQKETTTAIPARHVALAVLRSLRQRNPPARIRVASWQARAQLFFQRRFPTRFVDAAIRRELFSEELMTQTSVQNDER